MYDLEHEGGTILRQEDAIAEYEEKMERFFSVKMTAFLILLAKMIREAVELSVKNFKEDGAKYADVKYIEETLGIKNGKIEKYHGKKMTVLFAIGSLWVLRNDVTFLTNNSFNGMVKRKDLWRAVEKSVNRKYYDFFETYAIGTIFQSYNASQLSFARKYDYEKFIYQGGIVEESRDFCIERAGLEFHRSQGLEWNEMDWKGKIPGVDFFIQCGGYNCLHHIEWIE